MLRGEPFSADFDTVVRVAGVEAEVLDVTRADCTACDACRSENACTVCETCEPCADACASCEQSVTFEVPLVDAGEQPLVLVNRFGTSDAVVFEVLEAEDTGDTGDTGL